MDITFPPELQWVSYLAGGAWPQGSETRMARINEHFASAANDLQNLIPDLNRVRNETLSVLVGDTAMAAVDQFAMLFGGDYSVDKLAQGAAALGGGAQSLGSEIEYSKLSIIVGLGLAAVEIGWCLANSVPTGGASMAWLPAIEWTTMASIRRLMTQVFTRITEKLARMLEETTIKELVHHMSREAVEELGQGLLQEGIVQGVQVGKGTGTWRPDLFRQNGIASLVGGAAGGGTAVPVGHGLGPAASKLGRAGKGMTTMFTAGIAGNLAGTTAVGGEFDTLSIVAGSAGSSVGGIKGIGGHGPHPTTDPHTGLPVHAGGPPSGEPLPDGALDGEDLARGATGDDDTRLAEPNPDEPSVHGNHANGNHTDGNGQAPSNVGARVAAPPTGEATHGRVNGVAAQGDTEARTSRDAADQQTAKPDAETDAEPSTHPSDAPETSAPPAAHSAGDAPAHQSEHQRAATNPVVDEPHPSHAQNGSPAADHTQIHTDQTSAPEPEPGSTVEAAAHQPATIPADTASADAVRATPTAPAPPVPPAATSTPSAAVTQHQAAAQPPAAASTTADQQSTSNTPAPAPARTAPQSVSASPSKATSTPESAGAPAARISESVAEAAKPATTIGAEPTVVAAAEPAVGLRQAPDDNCARQVADALSSRYGRDFDVPATSTATGVPARALFEGAGTRADFATYSDVADRLRQLGPGSSAILTSRWAGDGHRQGGHAYVAVNDGGDIHLIDSRTGERTGWPPHWGQDAVSRTAVGYLDARGDAVHPISGSEHALAAADVIGDVKGHPDHDPGERWRDVTPQRQTADDALAGRGVQSAEELRNPLGLMEAGSERARLNATWWHGLTGDEQRALIDVHPQHIGNAEGIPAGARHAANTRALDQQRSELHARRDRGERLTRFQRRELARLDRIRQALDTGGDLATQAGVGGPLLLAFDSGAFGGDGRAVVSFGEDPYKADMVAWHVPGQGMTIDQLGYCMGDALNHLQSTLHEDPSVSASSIAWIGYDTPSGRHSWRAAGHAYAREGAKILYADIRAFNTVRDTLADDGSHFSANNVFAHSYGATTMSYAGQDGRLANDIRTVTLAGSSGVGPLQHANDFGIGADNVYVASSSRDPFTGLGGRTPGSMGRVFGIGLGVDPAMQSFGAQRVTAEFSSTMDSLRNRGTHNAYYRFADRGADPPLRSESLANFGRIASGHVDRVDTEAHRTVGEGRRRLFGGTREGTVEPAADRPLRLDGDTESSDRVTHRTWNPRWRGVEPTGQAEAADHTPAAQLEPQMSSRERADLALAERGMPADELMSPADHEFDVDQAVARAQANAHWWRGLSDAQRQALIETHPHQIGNAEGIPPMDRHEANSRMLQRHLAERDLLVTRRQNGFALSKKEQKFVDLMDQVERAIRTGERNAQRAGVGGPYLLAFDPFAFDGVGRAIVSVGDDPYKATSVSWYVPGMSTTIEKLNAMMNRGFNQLQSTLRENPELSAASITYLGYKPPGSWDANVLSRQMAIDGGQIFASDMLSFNAGRDIFTGDGSHFSGNHVFAHSYGSATVSHAGDGRRLANEVRTITLIGSPGAGNLRHASEFGIGDNVFVASSSRDLTTALGGDRPGRFGRNHSPERIGQGVDPAMDSFGARRITAEFPAAIDRAGGGSRMTHSLYWAYMDPGANPRVRSESLTNFGRIAAGRTGDIDTEGHRRLDQRPRWIRSGFSESTVEPAIGRHLRLADDPTAHHPVTRRNPWNPRFRNLPPAAEVPRPVVESAPEPELTAAEVGEVQQAPVPVKVVADAALQDRGIRADDLMSPVDHRVSVDRAVARAEANGTWWKGLTDNQRSALIEAYPHQIGNAEGIPPMDRHEANSRMLQRYLAHRDVLVSRRQNGVAINKKQAQFVELMDQIEDAMRKGVANAGRAGVGGPYLLALDPRAFGGAGRAIVSFGEDPYTAKSVSWYVPGMTTTIDKMHPMMMRAFNQLQSTLQQDPSLSAASITYIGYRAPGSWDPNVIAQRLARNGGEIFASDISSFNAGRDVFTGDGSHFNGNHVFAHSYGSSTVSHAGQGGRLGSEMRTVTLIGSPGAGPLRHASDFGIGADNVFVASSSRDRTTALGGDRPGHRGRSVSPSRIGQGVDPAMDSFGARRVTAEFPAAVDHTGPGSRMTHSLYWAYMDQGASPRVRSESLTNFGRIAAGQTGDIDVEGHRRVEERPRRFGSGSRAVTVEPAVGRHLRLADDPTAHHSVHGRNYWNPNFERTNDCGPAVIDELSARYPGREFHLTAVPSSGGVRAFRLFEAVRSSAEFATYAQIEERLRALGPGSSALLASSWSGWASGGHAYLAVNDGGEIQLVDAHSGVRSGWPPHWGQDAVSRTAVGYLRSDGAPVAPYEGRARQLAAAGRIGRVQGLPESGVMADAALAHRGISADELVNPVGSTELAAERARANAAWWTELSDAERRALIEVHPYRIGNAEGVPAVDRDTANRSLLQELRDGADHIQTKIDEFTPVSGAERKFLARVNDIDLAIRKAEADAARAGLDRPLILALDPSEFGGNGRAVISFGADPYHADNVSWHTARQTVDELGTVVRPALDQLLSTQQQTPSAAAIVWVGAESKPRLALHSDIAAFHAAREAMNSTGDGTPFTGNRVHTAESSSTGENLWVPRDAGSMVVAHRGASHEFPEQTMAAYREALRQGAAGLECDVRLTKDGQLVCIHDKSIDRTSNGTGRVSDMTLAELQEFDFGAKHPSHRLGDAQGDTGILTLDDLVQLVKDHDSPVTLFIEAKEHSGRLARELVALLDRHGLANPASPDKSRVAVISFYPQAIWRVHHAAPNLPTVLLGVTALHLAGPVGATAIGPSIKALRANPEMVEIAARQGLTTYCWTVNDESDVQFARDLGVGWIATDHPGRTEAMVHADAGAPASTGDGAKPTAELPVPAGPDPANIHAVADAALAQRIPPVRADELRNPMGPTEESRARARNNASWWSGLSDEQRNALIEAHPQHIGNAEGIPSAARDAANRHVVQQLRDRADRVQAKIDEGTRPSRAERKFLQQVNRLDLALRKASADAAQAGVGGPLLIAFDPAEFGGDGRAVLSFGADPYQADSVSWHVPGVATTVHSLFGFYTESALNHLQSTLSENPTKSAASIAWIGYDTPSGLGIVRAAGHQLARAGGDLLYSDITAFNAARDTLAADGSHFTGNHVFGYSYGSTTTGYAGRDGRLAGEISTVSLVGSPGAGPVRRASDFGIGADNVFVASSSRDLVTSLGGRTPGSSGRVLGIGLGVDPAMDSFGAQRIAAESPSARNLLSTGGTHHAYYLDTETGTHVRSESLTNLGRVAAGQHDRLTHETHRTVDGGRTIEPAANRSDHRVWNPPWRSDRDCAHVVADELSAMFGRDIQIAHPPGRAGVPARALFDAVGSRAEFATYADVADRLRQLGDGSTAVLASSWAGGRNGGHAYLAVNEGGEIRLYDPHTRQRSGWPPHWGQDAVSRTAVGYLGAHGNAIRPLSVDTSLQLAAADAIGNVRGHRADPDFVRRQAEYRAQDPTTRHVDTRYAQSLADVIDNPSQSSVDQLAADLSGMYGPYRIRLDEIDRFGNEVLFTGKILHGDTEIGTIQRGFARDAQGSLVAYHNGLVIKDEFTQLRGQGFSKALTAEMERFYVHSGVDRIELQSHDKGTRAWARRGFTWDPDPARLQQSLDRIRDAAHQLSPRLSSEARTVLDEVVQRLHPDHPRLPELIDIVDLAAPGVPDLGERLVDGVKVNFVRYLPSDVTTDATPQAHNGFGARLKRLFGLGSGARADQDCAHVVADELSAMYGRDVRVATARSRMGVPAWALFEAVATRAEFATYTDVAERLAQLGDGSSAVLASRWADGHRGGHAYLAINEGGEIRLYDPHTRARSGWPPHWGQGAVAHTAVGYLDADGNPVQSLHDVPLQLQLAAADVVGDVRGHPRDPDFARRQEEYRAEDPTTRRVDARYAEPLGPVVDSASSAGAARVAEDLSGHYGDYRVTFDGFAARGSGIALDGDILAGDGQMVILEGPIHRGEQEVGNASLTFYRDDHGRLVAHYELHADNENLSGREFSRALMSELRPHYARADIDRITSTTHGRGAYAAIDLGTAWDPSPDRLRQSLDSVRKSALELRDRVDGESRRVLDQIVPRLEPEHSLLPEPVDLANLYTFDEPELGRRLLEGAGSVNDGTGLHYVDYLWNGQLHSEQNCAHWVAEVLANRYGIPVQLDAPPSATGVAAREIFQAVGSRAEFATYAEISELLFQMSTGRPGEPGPVAIVVSSWAGGRSQGGHAYLAVYDGGEVHLLDPFTGERSGWPPYWGEGAVSRTAVGFLDATGRPVQHLDGGPDQLAAADAVGDVQGHPGHPDPAASQEEYRAQDPTTRRVDTRFAEPLGDVVDNLDPEQVRRLGDDLSGVYGPYRVEMWRAEISRAGEVIIGGDVISGDEVVGFVQRTFVRDGDGHLVIHDNAVDIPDDRFRYKGFSKALVHELEQYYERSGADRIEMRTEQDGGHAWARRGFTWNPDPRKLQASLDSIKESAAQLRDRVGPEARALLDDVVQRLDPRRPDLPEPIDLAVLSTPDEPHLGRQLLTDTHWHGVKYLRAAATDTPSPDVPLRLETAAALPGPVSDLDLPNYAPGSLSETEASTVYAHGELRMRELNEQFVRDGISAEDRARILSERRNSLRAWTRDLMSNRTIAEFLAANESTPSFDELVSRNEARGLAGDAVYEAIIDSASHGRFAPATLSDVETTSVYSDFELRLRDLNEQLVRDGMPVDERARLLSDLRSSLRRWTRDLMSNRAAADWLAANESNPSFEDLVARYEAKGLSGDAVYEAIVDSATHSHYAANTLSNAETRTVYTTFELRMREVGEQLRRDDVGLEEQARTLYELRASIRTWTRALMADRDTADYLTANEPNPTFEDLVERQRAKGRVGDEIYQAIIASATRSRASVNESLGIDPENPPDLPPMRGPTNNDLE